MRDMVWKGSYRGVAIPAVCVVGAICVSIFAESAFGGQSDGGVAPGLVAAAGKVAVRHRRAGHTGVQTPSDFLAHARSLVDSRDASI